MSRTWSRIFVATLATLAMAMVAQEGILAASQPRFSQEAIRRHANSAAARAVALPGHLTSQPAAGADPAVNHSWDTLAGMVEPGRKLVITLVDSTNVEGKLDAIDTQSISIAQPGGVRTIEVADVLRVRDAGVRKRHVFYGMLIGAVAGAVGTVAIDHHSSHPEAAQAAGMGAILIGLPGGALVGAALPVGPPLYEAVDAVRRTP